MLLPQWPLTLRLQGAVLVHLKSAENLAAADDNGLSDPFAKLILNGKTVKSAIMWRSLDPTWDEKHDWADVRSPRPCPAPKHDASAQLLMYTACPGPWHPGDVSLSPSDATL